MNEKTDKRTNERTKLTHYLRDRPSTCETLASCFPGMMAHLLDN